MEPTIYFNVTRDKVECVHRGNYIEEMLQFDITDECLMIERTGAVPDSPVVFQLYIKNPIHTKSEFCTVVTDLMNHIVNKVFGQYADNDTVYFIYDGITNTVTIKFPFLSVVERMRDMICKRFFGAYALSTYLKTTYKICVSEDNDSVINGQNEFWIAPLSNLDHTWIIPVSLSLRYWTFTNMFGKLYDHISYKSSYDHHGAFIDGHVSFNKFNKGSSACICSKCLLKYDVEVRDSDTNVYEAINNYTKLTFIATSSQFKYIIFSPKPFQGIFNDVDIDNFLLKFVSSSIPPNTLQDPSYRYKAFLKCLSVKRLTIIEGDVDKSFDAVKVFKILGQEAFDIERQNHLMPRLTNSELKYIDIMLKNQELNLTYLTILHYASIDDPKQFNMIIGDQILTLFVNGIVSNNYNLVWFSFSYLLLGKYFSYNAPSSKVAGFTNEFYMFDGKKLTKVPDIIQEISASIVSGQIRSTLDELYMIVKMMVDIAINKKIESPLIDVNIFNTVKNIPPITNAEQFILYKLYPEANGKGITRIAEIIRANLNTIASVNFKFDSNPCCFGLNNGVLYTIDIDTYGNSKVIYRKCEPEDYVTKFSPANYNPSVYGTDKYKLLVYRMKLMFNDPEVYSWVMSYLAGTLRGIPPKIAMFLYGGSNTGKTTLSCLMSNTLGNSYTSPLGTDYFTRTNTDTSKPNPTVVSAVRGRLTTTEEFTGTINCEVFKEKTGGRTRINERSLYQSIDEGGTISMCRFLFLTNNIPIIKYDPAAIHRIGLVKLETRYVAADSIQVTEEGAPAKVHAEVNNIAAEYATMADEMMMHMIRHYDVYRNTKTSKFCDIEKIPDQMKIWRKEIITNSDTYTFLEANVVQVENQPGIIMAVHDLVNIIIKNTNKNFQDTQTELTMLLPSYCNIGGIIGWTNIIYVETCRDIKDCVRENLESYPGAKAYKGFYLKKYRDMFEKPIDGGDVLLKA